MTTLIPCPQCNTASSVLLQTQDFNRHITDEVFNYYQCPACGLIFIAPIPPNLSEYYPASYYQLPSTIAEFAPRVDFQRYKIELVKRFVKSGKLLEIGPGAGDFSFMAKQAGFAVDAIEMDEKSCQFLRAVIGVNAINSDDPLNAVQSLGQYDVIALWHVIEHLANPWSILDTLTAHIAPGGILVIAAPNPDSLQFKLFGRYWTHLDAPRHLELISIKLLTEYLTKQGWKRLLVTTSAGAFKFNFFGWRQSLKNRFGTNLTLKYPAALVNLLFMPLERTGWRDSAYTLIFQK